MIRVFLALLVSFAPLSANAQMKDAAQIRPILEMTKANWIGVRRFDGKDLIYFTHLESWRCGLNEIKVGINGDVANLVYPMEVCGPDEGAPSPVDTENRLPYVEFPLDSIVSVTIELTYDDGEVVTETFQRKDVEIP